MRRRPRLDAAGTGRTEKQVATRNVVNGGLHERLRVVFVTAKNVGPDDRPVREREEIVARKLDLVVSDERDDIDAEQRADLVQVRETAAGAEVGRGNELDALNIIAAFEFRGDALEQHGFLLFGNIGFPWHERDADAQREPKHRNRRGRQRVGLIRIKITHHAARALRLARAARGKTTAK